jgi:predicted aminopeptidase
MRNLAAVAALVLCAGCESLSFYGQAIGGHLSVIAAAKPVDYWLDRASTPPELKARLEAARGIRAFATKDLHLPDNGSYTAYADLGRRFVVWNVFAAPQFSVEPKQECFPFTGCVSYRGFFSEENAQRHAARLREEGFDVYVGGVPAYSTLGWFDDPLLSTFIFYPESQVARLVFHELAHQVAYARDDTTFNESFAVVVEEEGVRRWLESRGRGAELAEFHAAQARKRVLADAIKDTRGRLAAVYASGADRARMLERKRAEFERLRSQFPNVVPAEPNNAFLVSIALYNELVPPLERLLAKEGSLDAFYTAAKKLAHEGAAERKRALQ